MKKIIQDYTFNPASQTIKASDFTKLAEIALITNVTDNIVIYDALDSTLGGTLSGDVLTLEYDTTAMSSTDSLQIITHAGTDIDRIGFAKTISNGVDTTMLTLLQTGAGMTVNQTGGNLVITAGTTARSETIIRGINSYSGGIRARIQSLLSQRVVNQQFFYELVDVVGDSLTYTINSATSITVTLPASFGLSAQNIGQSMTLQRFVGTGTFLSGRYPIASVSGNDATFTVSGFTVGTGTLSAVGWNFYRLEYSGTTATNALFDTGRNGYASGNTTATINTTAAPGHMAIINSNDGQASLLDQLVASTASVQTANRASRVIMVPDDAQVYMQIRIVNGATAPTATTWTIGQVSVGHFEAESVIVQDMRPVNFQTALPVEIARSASLATTISSGTVTTLTTLTTLANGQTAHSSASTGSPLRVGGRILPTTPDTTLVAGDASDLGITTGQQTLIKTYSAGEQDFTFNGTIVNSAAAIPFKNAAGASIRNWLTSLTLTSDILATATEVVIRDGDLAGSGVASNVFTTASHDFKIGDQVVFTTINTFTGAVINTPYYVLTVPLATTFTLSATPNGSALAITGTGTFTIHRVLFRTKLQTASLAPTTIDFTTPLRGSPNAIMSIQGITASATGVIYYNARGYVGV